MNPQLREAIGKASYEALLDELETPWSELNEDAKEVNRRSAEGAVSEFVAPIMTILLNFYKSLDKLSQEQQDAIRLVVRVATGKELEEL